ncbi:DUF2971 domain-containing protein [Nitrosomonas sp. Nm132]|jgi:hypothetical protein|uniref:DUF2971 domain-containing protein n=1 Tax=Nitrosomonas sp. Nm132 TaxID=1881053 RepID=UPI00087FC954|nr:DUF2971 domain-containing protein [Nitrosomonas sp. Nm132]SDH97020.1 Protein of unknown function [Nitrosomonas sp. Nm132]
MENIVYRYTGQDTFLRMLESKDLWFSDITKMNDWDEYMAGYRIVERIITKDFSEKLDILQTVSPSQLNNRFKILICSFSYEDDCLSLWNGYGNYGHGLSIGYSEDDVQNYCLINRFLLKGQPVNGNVWFKPIIYNELTFEKEIRDRINEHSRVTIHINDEKFIEKNVASLINDGKLGLALMRLCSIYKNEKFKDERETRAVIEISDTVDTYKVETRESNYGNLAYHKLNISFEETNAIKKIVLGPKCKLSEDDVFKKLKTNGLSNVEIARSRISYR